MVKNPPASAGDTRDMGSIPGWGRSPWRRKWLATPFLHAWRIHGQKSLAGYSPWGHKESDTTEVTEHNTTFEDNSVLQEIFEIFYCNQDFNKVLINIPEEQSDIEHTIIYFSILYTFLKHVVFVLFCF